MASEADSKAASAPGLWGWINQRLPIDAFWRSQASE